MGFMGEDPVQTPYLDRFSKESITFTRAIACSPVCSPNRACWFTGRYPQNHGVVRNGRAHVNPDHLLSRSFKQNGFRNGYIGKWHLNGADSHKTWKGITPEFLRSDYETWTSAIHNHDHFRLIFEEDGKAVDHGNGWQPDYVTNKAIEFLDQQDQRPFNLVVSFGPPHNGSYHPDFCTERRNTPGDDRDNGYAYYGPAEYEELYDNLDPNSVRKNMGTEGFGTDLPGAVKGYFGGCTALDACFGKLIGHLKQTGLLDRTIVVFTSDHGEMLGSQNLMTKGVPFEESIRVPLMIRVPGTTPYVDERLFSSVDLMPTLMGLTQQDIPDGVDGHDYSGSLDVEKASTDAPDRTYIGLAGWRGFRTKRYTYVASARSGNPFGGREIGYLRKKRPDSSLTHMLFDLENDPYQMSPIIKGDGKETDTVIDTLHKQLQTHLTSLGEKELIPNQV